MTKWQRVVAKFKEPSTIRGLLIIVGVMGFNLSDDTMGAVVTAIASVIGLYEAIRSEYTEEG